MRNLWPVVAVLTGVAGSVVAQDAAPVQPSFKRYPSGEQMVKLYPSKAKYKRIDGDVVIACGWDARGRLKACRVISETPEGYGFAEATVKGFESYGEMKDITGESAVGEEKKVRYRWTIR